MTPKSPKNSLLSRRKILKGLGIAPIALRPAPFLGASFLPLPPTPPDNSAPWTYADLRLRPHYPQDSRLADILRLVPPGSDSYITEKQASEIAAQLALWTSALCASPANPSAIAPILAPVLSASPLTPASQTTLRTGFGIDALRRSYGPPTSTTPSELLYALTQWLGPFLRIETAECEIFAISPLDTPDTLRTHIRYDFVFQRPAGIREERVGAWHIDWSRTASGNWLIQRWEAGSETISTGHGPGFQDVTLPALGATASHAQQFAHGIDHWRSVIDGACGIDLYSNNGVAVGDFDNDGFDDFYVCQPAGLPNRLYRNRGDGSFDDVTEIAGVGILDNTASAIFADFDNRGLQDLLIVTGSGPMLYRNQGNGTFQLKPDAFHFAAPPQGTFTHAAVADYDGDGRLDIYFCLYMYYLGLDQYHYPVPYYDARNGPPNCLLHNQGDGNFVERTLEAGLNADNDRYSFSAAWGDSNGNGHLDLCVVNDFGKSQLYRNNGNGTFTVVSAAAHLEDVGAGMSAAWCDYDNDGHQDIYIPSMWEAAGQRVSSQPQFHQDAPEDIRILYRRHSMGNALYRNQGDGTFRNVGHQTGVDMGRWSWSSDFLDFDHDGSPDLYVSNGYISAQDRNDLASFFWRQVVGNSPEDASSALAYERGWNAINELIRSDNSWNAWERNVLFANNRDGSFSEVSGVVGMDFLEDGRSFALADLDHDGRLEVILRNRTAPQLRILHNQMESIGQSITFNLRGTKSNRDAIGASVTLEIGSLRQTRYLQAGSGFLAQHSKTLHFGIANPTAPIQATVRWPSGLTQTFPNLQPNTRISLVEGESAVSALPFAPSPKSWASAPAQPPAPPLPTQVATWLLQPLQAPDFTLPDQNATPRSLSQFQGKCTLLHFWATLSLGAADQLRQLDQARPALAPVQFLAINLDQPPSQPAARELVAQLRLTYPALQATDDVAGIYNIIYRYLFDRRRDLGIPTSFLLDPQGRIVKLYQGAFDPRLLLDDLRRLPATTADRMKLALPFPGQLLQPAFQRNDFTYGVAMFQHGYLDQAQAAFQQVVAAKPDNADGYYNLGTLSLQRHDLAAARTHLQRAIQLRPDYPEAFNNLGMIAAQQGQPTEAVQDFTESLRLRPNYTTALLNLGNLYRRQAAFPQAAQALNRALALQPDDPEIHYSLGLLHAQQDQAAEAESELRKAISLRPNYPEALTNLGVLFVRQQQYPQAEEQFLACIRIAPQYDQAYLNLARLYLIQGNPGHARSVLNDLLSIHPNSQAAQQGLEALK
jgi:tetratricopeptide (TPR) repeat protein